MIKLTTSGRDLTQEHLAFIAALAVMDGSFHGSSMEVEVRQTGAVSVLMTPAPKVVTTSNLSIGDRVRIIKSGILGDDFLNGIVGEIRSLDPDDHQYPFEVETPENGAWWVSEVEIA